MSLHHSLRGKVTLWFAGVTVLLAAAFFWGYRNFRHEILVTTGKAIAAIRQRNAFYGVVDILARAYFTGYEPILDQGGETIGIWYVGYLIETLPKLGSDIEKTRILDNGYLALLDAKQQVV